MACMEHVCSNSDCQWAGANNKPNEPSMCPWCGSPVLHFWDEQYDDHEGHDEHYGTRIRRRA